MKRLAWVFFPLLVSACSPWHDIPDDLRFVSLNNETGPHKRDGRGEILDIEVETNFNYMSYLSKKRLWPLTIFYFCDQKEMYVQGLGGLGFFKMIDNHWIAVESGTDDPSPPPYRYHTTIRAESHEKSPFFPKEPTILDYDLRQTPRDICFYLAAGAIYYHEQSNVVRIPKEELAKFFAEHPKP